MSDSMDSLFLPPESLLTLDIGSSMTRAALFDVVEGSYNFLGSGIAPSTIYPPAGEMRRGIRWALDELSAALDRPLVDSGGRLLRPQLPGESGASHLSATYSIAPPLKILAFGLSPDYSLTSLIRLARCIPCQSLDAMDMQDGRRTDEHLDEILRLRPDLILVAGGSDGRGSQAVVELIDTLALACSLLPAGDSPLVLYCGNQAYASLADSRLSHLAHLVITPNLRPRPDQENLEPAMHKLVESYHQLCKQRLPWLSRLENLVQGNLGYSGYAFGRLVRYLNRLHPGEKGVLGVDLSASAATIAAAFSGELTLQVSPEYGLGSGLVNHLGSTALKSIASWSRLELPEAFIREYLLNKSLYPESLPLTPETVELEQSLARYLLRQALRQVRPAFSTRAVSLTPEGLPMVEPVLASGALLANAPDPIQSLLVLLDGLQPAGISTLVLDEHLVAPGLGQALTKFPTQVVQLLGSNAFLHLATVIAPVGQARPGTPVLRINISYDNGDENGLEIKQGELRLIPISPGQPARLQLTPLQQFDIGMGSPGRGGSLRLTGSALGVVVDARGRPLQLPANPAERRQRLASWSAGLQASN